MTKIASALFFVASVAAIPSFADSKPRHSGRSSPDEFLQLETPDRNVDGAYYGLGVTLSHISHRLKATKNNGSIADFSKAGNQFDVSFIGGFGSDFYKKFYAGIEVEFLKRFSGKTAREGEVGIVHTSAVGLNMDVRFGYLLPQYGSLVYLTAGCARVVGGTEFLVAGTGQYRQGRSCGSFYPTFGAGVEYKINPRWNIRGDFRISITSADDNKHFQVNGTTVWTYELKPSRSAFRLSITRNI